MRKLNTLFNGSPSNLKPLLFKISECSEITFQIKKQLPDFIATHCNQCTINEKRLTILVDNPIWVSRLRFYTPSLLEKLNQQFPYQFSTVKIRVLPSTLSRKSTPVDTKVIPSKSVAELVQESASHTQDSELKAALQKLSKTLNSLS